MLKIISEFVQQKNPCLKNAYPDGANLKIRGQLRSKVSSIEHTDREKMYRHLNVFVTNSGLASYFKN